MEKVGKESLTSHWPFHVNAISVIAGHSVLGIGDTNNSPIGGRLSIIRLAGISFNRCLIYFY